MKTYGRIDIIINNAGILRDISLMKLNYEDWKLVMDVHLYGSFKMCQAVWPIFLTQKYGRIINTASAVGLHGNFGQANYASGNSFI